MKKLKGLFKSLHPDVILGLFAAFTAVAIGVRAYQLMYIFEPDTGFYVLESKNSITIPLLYALVAASCVLFIVLSFLCGKLPEEKAPVGKNYFIGTGSIFFSITLVIDGMLRFSQLFNQLDASDLPMLKALIELKKIPQALEILFALIAALYFVIIAVSYISGNGTHASSKVMSLAPVCWMMFRLINRFVLAVSFINKSEIFWELLMIAFMMIFFMGFARIMSDIGSKGKLAFTMGTGLCGAMIAFMIGFSRIITYVFAGSAYLIADSPVELSDIGAGAVVFLFLLSCIHDLQPHEIAAMDEPDPVRAPVLERKEPDDEAFRIAEQYANRYITEEPLPFTQSAPVSEAPIAEPQADSDSELPSEPIAE